MRQRDTWAFAPGSPAPSCSRLPSGCLPQPVPFLATRGNPKNQIRSLSLPCSPFPRLLPSPPFTLHQLQPHRLLFVPPAQQTTSHLRAFTHAVTSARYTVPPCPAVHPINSCSPSLRSPSTYLPNHSWLDPLMAPSTLWNFCSLHHSSNYSNELLVSWG